jgi:hypothetical protein
MKIEHSHTLYIRIQNFQENLEPKNLIRNLGRKICGRTEAKRDIRDLFILCLFRKKTGKKSAPEKMK